MNDMDSASDKDKFYCVFSPYYRIKLVSFG